MIMIFPSTRLLIDWLIRIISDRKEQKFLFVSLSDHFWQKREKNKRGVVDFSQDTSSCIIINYIFIIPWSGYLGTTTSSNVRACVTCAGVVQLKCLKENDKYKKYSFLHTTLSSRSTCSHDVAYSNNVFFDFTGSKTNCPISTLNMSQSCRNSTVLFLPP